MQEPNEYDEEYYIQNEIRNIPEPEDFDLSSFAESRNEMSKYFKNSKKSAKTNHNKNIFPHVPAPSVEFSIDPNIRIIERYPKDCEEDSQHSQKQVILNQKHNQNKSFKNDAGETRRLTTELAMTREANQQLIARNEELEEQLQALKEELDSKNKLINIKNNEIKKQKDKCQALCKKLQQFESEPDELMLNRMNELEILLKKKEEELKRTKTTNLQLSTALNDAKAEYQSLKLTTTKQLQEQAKKIKSITKELTDSKFISKQLSTKLESQKSHSLKGSMYSTQSIMESFAPEMLSPQQTIELIYEVFKRVSKSMSMLKVLYQNRQFLSLIETFTEDKMRRRLNHR